MSFIKVNEIFDSIDGEGKRAGELTSFVRLTGCNLRCSYCDSTYTFRDGRYMEVEDVVRKVTYRNVTITGGEPLCQDIHSLLDNLQRHDVNIETNGSKNITEYMNHKNTWFTVDYKCACSGMEGFMLESNFRNLRPCDVLKFVVGSGKDLDTAKELCERIQPKAQVYISPVFGMIMPKDIVQYMKDNYMETWRVQLQLHKYIWEPEKRGV